MSQRLSEKEKVREKQTKECERRDWTLGNWDTDIEKQGGKKSDDKERSSNLSSINKENYSERTQLVRRNGNE